MRIHTSLGETSYSDCVHLMASPKKKKKKKSTGCLHKPELNVRPIASLPLDKKTQRHGYAKKKSLVNGSIVIKELCGFQLQSSLQNSIRLSRWNIAQAFPQMCQFRSSWSWQSSLKSPQISKCSRVVLCWRRKTKTCFFQTSILSASLVCPCCPKYNR